jgi:phosphoserine phosphatase
VIIVTGQSEPLLAPMLLKMDGVEGIGTPLTYEDGHFSGRLGGPLNQGQRKVEQLIPFLRDGHILAAYGDTESDLSMLAMSHSPVAVYPDEGLRREAIDRGWRILEDAGS